MKIILINPNTRYMGGLYTVYPPLGLLYISSILLNNKNNVSIIDADVDNLSIEDIKEKINVERPQIVGITMNTFQTKSAYETAHAIKNVNSTTIVVVGGPHPTIVEKEVLNDCKSIDFSVIGEGEFTMLELVNTIKNGGNFSDINGICYRDDGNIRKTQPRKFIENLDILPLPAFELVRPIERYQGPFPTGARPTIQVMASRGCPFQCTFCSNPVWDKKIRFRSPESILKEVEGLQKKFGIREVFFQDDTFNLNREWFEKICNGIIDKGLNNKIIFKAPFRVNENLIDNELLKLAKKAGFWMIFYGVESGNQEILNITRKGVILKEIERAFKLTKKAGIKTMASFMIGNIDETPDTIKDTINFAKKLDPDYYGFAIATPYPGSSFYDTAKKRGYIQVNDYTKYDLRKYILKTEHLSEIKVKKLAIIASLSVKKYKHSLKYRMKKFIELFLIMGFRRALWEIQDQGIEDCDYLPTYSDDVSPSFLKNVIEMGVNNYHVLGKGCLGKGWHQCENWPPKIRWTSKKATAYLKVNNSCDKLLIKTITYFPNIKGKIFLGKKVAKNFEMQDNEWKLLEVDLPDLYNNELIEVTIELNNTWIPDEVMKNGDTRKIGIAVNKIWVE